MHIEQLRTMLAGLHNKPQTIYSWALSCVFVLIPLRKLKYRSGYTIMIHYPMFERHVHEFQMVKLPQSNQPLCHLALPYLSIAVREQLFMSIICWILYIFVGHGYDGLSSMKGLYLALGLLHLKLRLWKRLLISLSTIVIYDSNILNRGILNLNVFIRVLRDF